MRFWCCLGFTWYRCRVAVGMVLCLFQLSFLRDLLLCASCYAIFPMSDTFICVSAQFSHPFQPNKNVQMFWQEARQPVRETGAPSLLLETSLTALLMRPRQRFPRLPQRCQGSKIFCCGQAQARQPRVVLLLAMKTISRARAPTASDFPRHGIRAAFSHHFHQMTGCRRPCLSACHQVFSRHPLFWMPTAI